MWRRIRAPPAVPLAEIGAGKHPSVRSAGALCLQTLRPDVELSNVFETRVEVGGWGRGRGREGCRLPHPILFSAPCLRFISHPPQKRKKSNLGLRGGRFRRHSAAPPPLPPPLLPPGRLIGSLTRCLVCLWTNCERLRRAAR